MTEPHFGALEGFQEALVAIAHLMERNDDKHNGKLAWRRVPIDKHLFRVAKHINGVSGAMSMEEKIDQMTKAATRALMALSLLIASGKYANKIVSVVSEEIKKCSAAPAAETENSTPEASA